eukprot:Skav230480  [mRNA]  locus=scaffold1445:308829:309020:+ [translate_table: standard]
MHMGYSFAPAVLYWRFIQSKPPRCVAGRDWEGISLTTLSLIQQPQETPITAPTKSLRSRVLTL